MKLKLKTGKETCERCSLLHTTACPHAYWINDIDLLKHHCSSFKKKTVHKKSMRTTIMMGVRA